MTCIKLKFAAILLVMTGCENSDDAPGSGDGVVCQTSWFGELSYDGPMLGVVSCLSSDVCSDRLQLFLDWANDDVHESHADDESFNVNITAYPADGESALSPSRIALMVAVPYLPPFAQSLKDTDRATLTLTDDAGVVIVNSTSEVGYKDSLGSDSDPPCRALALDLDGRIRSETQ